VAPVEKVMVKQEEEAEEGNEEMEIEEKGKGSDCATRATEATLEILLRNARPDEFA